MNERIMKPEGFIQSLGKGIVMIIKQTSLYCDFSTWRDKKGPFI